jgi:hypothetical protein
MKAVRLTRPDGSQLYLGHGFIVEAPSHFAAGASTQVTFHGVTRQVRETPDEAIAKIEEAAHSPEPASRGA